MTAPSQPAPVPPEPTLTADELSVLGKISIREGRHTSDPLFNSLTNGERVIANRLDDRGYITTYNGFFVTTPYGRQALAVPAPPPRDVIADVLAAIEVEIASPTFLGHASGLERAARIVRDIAVRALVVPSAAHETRVVTVCGRRRLLMTVYEDVKTERDRQDAKWGTIEQNPHSSWEWIQILREEFKEAEHEADTFGPNWRTELIHVAAVAIAAIEQYDMQTGRSS